MRKQDYEVKIKAIDSYLTKFLVLLAFWLSGVAALVYQVAWQRILALHSGVGIYSIAIIVSVFMAGLGLGSYFGGKLVSRVRASSALLWFAGFELAIGVWALLSCHFYYHWLGSQATWLYSSLTLTGVCHFLSLLPPTCLMGMSLPFLAQAAIRDVRSASKTIGMLYGINIFGAAIGALLTPWFFIRFFGIDGAIKIGAILSLAAGLIAALIWFVRKSSVGQNSSRENPPLDVQAHHRRSSLGNRLGLWTLLYALSGFFALALEIIWFRLVDVAVRSTAFTFGSVLSIYLLGLGIGCVTGAYWAVRIRSPLRGFLICQTAILLYTGLSILLLVRLPTDFPGYSELFHYWNSPDVFELGIDWNIKQIVVLYILLPGLFYGLPTILMGFSFSLLQRAVHDDLDATGQRVGFLQAANIVGNVLGSLLMGLILLEWFGTPNSLRTLLAFGLLFPFLGWKLTRDRIQIPAFVALVVVVAVWPSTTDFWSRLHGVEAGVGQFGEDASGLMAIIPSTSEIGTHRVSMNGKWQSWIPFGGIHSELGAVATILHPHPIDIAIIGLGSGDTAWAAACRKETKCVDVFEICAAEQRLLTLFSHQYTPLQRFLNDPRVSIRAEDGRRSLQHSGKKFDLIEADALRPQSAFAGNIYSTEFFQICARRLKPGGLMCQWAPTLRTYYTFVEVFPNVIAIPSRSILIGSNEPIAMDNSKWMQVLQRSDLQEYLGPEIVKGLNECLSTASHLVVQGEPELKSNKDLFPRDEFLTH